MNIFRFTDLAAFLRHHIARLPKNGRGEVTRLATHLDVSTTLVSQVLAGEKVFTPEQGHRLVEYLGLSALEADYLTFMIQRERAGSADLKKFWMTKMDAIREQSRELANRLEVDRKLSDREGSIFYSNPLYSAIRLYTSVGQHGKTLDEISERFALKRAKASAMLDFLVGAGLCKVENGRYFMGIQKTHLEEGSPDLLRHHCNWRLKAIRQSEDLSKDELMYTVAVSLSKKDFENLREDMMQFIEQFLKRVHASPAEEIACFTLDWFWVRK